MRRKVTIVADRSGGSSCPSESVSFPSQDDAFVVGHLVEPRLENKARAYAFQITKAHASRRGIKSFGMSSRRAMHANQNGRKGTRINPPFSESPYYTY